MSYVVHFASITLWFLAIHFLVLLTTSPLYNLKEAQHVLENNPLYVVSCCLAIGGFSGALVMVTSGHVWAGVIDALLVCIVFLIKRHTYTLLFIEKLILALVTVIVLNTL